MLEETVCKKGTLETKEMKSTERDGIVWRLDVDKPGRILHGDAGSISRIGFCTGSRCCRSAIYNIATEEYLHYKINTTKTIKITIKNNYKSDLQIYFW